MAGNGPQQVCCALDAARSAHEPRDGLSFGRLGWDWHISISFACISCILHRLKSSCGISMPFRLTLSDKFFGCSGKNETPFLEPWKLECRTDLECRSRFAELHVCVLTVQVLGHCPGVGPPSMITKLIEPTKHIGIQKPNQMVLHPGIWIVGPLPVRVLFIKSLHCSMIHNEHSLHRWRFTIDWLMNGGNTSQVNNQWVYGMYYGIYMVLNLLSAVL